MLNQILNVIIKLLGGVPMATHERLKKDLETQKRQLDAYSDFAKSIYTYQGSSEAWKAQQEFRQLMSECGRPVCNVEPWDFSRQALIDEYLGRVVDNFQVLIKKVDPPKYRNKEVFLNSEQLNIYRGDEYLTQLKSD